MRNAIVIIAACGVLGWAACGGKTPPPKTAKEAAAETKAAPPIGPARKISGEAKTVFLEAVQKYKEVAKAGLNKGNCGNIAAIFADVYANYPKVVEAKFNEGVVWQKCGDEAKAEQVYQEILRQHPGHGPTLNNIGFMLFSRGQQGAAQSYFKRAADAKNSEGYTNVALMQRDRALAGDSNALPDAVNNIHRALAVDSFNIEAYNMLATLLYDHAKTQSQLEMARLICVQATKVDETFAPIYNVLGLILLKMGRVTPALAEFRKAVERNPNFSDALMNIGAVTLSFRDYATAEQSFKKVLGLNPNKQMKYAATVGLGVALRGQRKFDEALAQYQAAEKLDPGNTDIAYNMGILIQDYRFDAADPNKAIATLQKAVGLLNRYMASARDRSQVPDAQRRVKNITEMIPMLQEQLKMTAGGK